MKIQKNNKEIKLNISKIVDKVLNIILRIFTSVSLKMLITDRINKQLITDRNLKIHIVFILGINASSCDNSNHRLLY